ncbi:MAG: N-6 DNA methylase [Bacteroidetes bacterium]|nr:N-6 DNA methylase [Bacteroidota bacterium]
MIREEAKSIIEKLVDRFREHRKDYHLTDYNEAKTRQDFINPFFKALGWDIDNEKGDSEAYREVIYEDKVVVKGKAKAPDYGFRLSGSGSKRLFYVEAKKPAVSLKTNKEAAYQLRRYGSSAQAFVSILTNFEDFIIYDCSKVPNLNDSSTVARLKHISFEDYSKEFDFIYDTFSHEAVTKGRFDKFVQSSATKKGTDTLDKRFVQSLDLWRKYLAVSIALNNRKINDEELNFAVQQTIDRLIFLRFCEDRAVEPYGQLQKAVSKGDAYKNLLDLFQQADDKYNSGLFDFEKDTITPTLKVDNKVIKIVIDELYYPKCNYEFSVMPVEILGNAYEQFLGKVIRITPARSVKIEEKPEVRKAGGVFYTPQYIVEYIVKNTVGKLVEGKTPKEIEKIKIVDPACGSGSFLLGAFEFLLNYHVNYYHQKGFATKKGKDNPFTPQGTLTTHEKKRILLSNIYGVDLDANAVEVTKLSLLLKCMEGETEASIKQQISLFHERVLPSLEENIKSGNSLIDTDFYDNEIDLDYEQKIKPFNWKKAFPEVFKLRKEDKKEEFKRQFNLVKQSEEKLKEKTEELLKKHQGKIEEPLIEYGITGGFDIVIGNPPYGALLTKDEDLYLRKKYDVANYQLDSYNLFIERATKIANNKAMFGFIIPSAWSASVYDDRFRKFLVREVCIDEIVITPKQTFIDATVETCIVLFSAGEPSKSFTINRWDKKNKDTYSVKLKSITSNPLFTFPIYSDPISLGIIGSVKKCQTHLSDFAEVSWGIKVYQKGKGVPPQKGFESDKKIFHSDSRNKKTHRPLVGGSDIFRYFFGWEGNYVDYGQWIAEPRKPEWFNGERIVVREVTSKGIILATYISGDYVFSNSVDGIKIINDRVEIKYLLGIINSKLISFYHSNTSPNAFKGTFPKVLLQDLRTLPIPESKTKTRNEIVKHVDLLLKLNEDFQTEKLPAKKEQIKQRIDHSEDKINELVYQLYDLTEKEIKIIEGGANE